jgi:hypothetical protein
MSGDESDSCEDQTCIAVPNRSRARYLSLPSTNSVELPPLALHPLQFGFHKALATSHRIFHNSDFHLVNTLLPQTWAGSLVTFGAYLTIVARGTNM